MTQLQHGIRKPNTYAEPKNFVDALHNPNWKAAMDVEFGALQKNKTWRLVPPQRGKNIIDFVGVQGQEESRWLVG
jgi:murein tripeptide amidase MpaA